MNIALQLVNKNYKVRIHPDELQEFIGEYKKIFNTQELRNTLSEYMIDDFFENVLKRNEKRIRSEIQNVDEVIRSNLINEQINIMSDTLRFLKSKYFDWHLNTLDNIFKRLKLMLSSTSEEAIKISTIHRAKGLENDRVFILKYNKLPYKRKLEWEQIQERNLHYVAVTRPKEELYLCMEDKFEGNEEELKSAIPLDHELCINNKKSEINDERQNGINIFTDNSVLLQFENDTEKVEDVIPPVIPSIGSPISFLPIQRINKIQDKFYAFDKYEDTPYPSLNQRLCQKAKYWSIYDNIKDTEFTISNVISTQYMDEYYIDTPTGIEIYKGRYKNSGQYTFTPQGTCGNREKILSILSNESNYKIKFNYEPQNSGFDSVHGLIQAFCQDLGVCNTNIYAENYALVYCFKMPDSYAYLRMTYNKHNVITTIASFSIIGEEDRTLRLLLEELKHLWQL